jgi:hypothetical protein
MTSQEQPTISSSFISPSPILIATDVFERNRLCEASQPTIGRRHGNSRRHAAGKSVTVEQGRFYSVRSAVIGFTLVARLAGKKQARSAALASIKVAVISANGSLGLTSYRILDRHALQPVKEARPAAYSESRLHRALSHNEARIRPPMCAQGHADADFAGPACHGISFHTINTDDG